MKPIILYSSAVILAGGFSRRFGSDKGLVLLRNKPLVNHVIDKVSPAVDEIVVVVSSEKQKEKFEKILHHNVRILIDKEDFQTPIVGAITGFNSANGDYSVLLPCDAPLISTRVIQFLLELSADRDAIIPRWPSGYIEPLQAVYNTKSALVGAKKALIEGQLNMRSMIDNLVNVLYVSTMVLQQFEPKLETFFNVNTLLDLEKAMKLLG